MRLLGFLLNCFFSLFVVLLICLFFCLVHVCLDLCYLLVHVVLSFVIVSCSLLIIVFFSSWFCQFLLLF